MARTTGPLMSQGAAGGLAHTLTYTRTHGGPTTKQQPHRSINRSMASRAARARMTFLQRQWQTTIVFNNLDPDWRTIPNPKQLPTYNIYLSTNLTRTSGNLGPLVDPLATDPLNQPTTTGLTWQQSARSITFHLAISAFNDGWGAWIYLLPLPFVQPTPQQIVASCDILNNSTSPITCTPVVHMKPGSTWFAAYKTFDVNGYLSATNFEPSAIIIP